jgi:hypothetical protein
MDKEYEFDEFVSGNPEKDKPADDYISLAESEGLQNHEGKKVSFEGTIAMVPWQHLIELPDTHRNINYVNVGKDQVVVYTKEAIECKAKVLVRGTVVKIQGKSKRPGSDEVFTEYQVVADSWQCIKYGS